MPISTFDEMRRTYTARPWVRYWARGTDMLLMVFLPALVVQYIWLLLGPPNLAVPRLAISLISCWLFVPLWIAAEIHLLTHWGTTPGKWLLGADVRTPEMNLLSTRQAFARTTRLFFFGYAAFIPILGIFTMLKAYRDVKERKTTLWDKATGTMVLHKPVKPFGVVLTIALIALNILLSQLFNLLSQ